jgi:hypothetical protein
MNMSIVLASTLIALLAGCASEVDKCVEAQMKSFATWPEPKGSAVEAEAGARVFCLRAANGKQ